MIKKYQLKETVDIPVGPHLLKGDLHIPIGAEALVVFSHGSGSSRLSPRNKFVAEFLEDEGFGTLLFDLLTPLEDQDYVNRFDIDLITKRLVAATEWVRNLTVTRELSLGYFGASTGAASAIRAATILGTDQVQAVVSRGGRPDLAQDFLTRLQAPCLLIVGERDGEVLRLNEEALSRMRCEKKMILVEGATHLFEEPGALEEVGDWAVDWFKDHLLRKEKKKVSSF